MDLLHFVKNAYIGTNATAQELFQCQLLSDGAIPVSPAALKEAVTHHALTQKKKDDCQNEYKQELSSSERGWLSFWRSRIHRIKPPSQSRPTLRSGDWESDLCIKVLENIAGPFRVPKMCLKIPETVSLSVAQRCFAG